ncbi:hypothetical protein ACOKM3_14150 [Streptomyces sp. BH106]|uniref:hypothetical protein n=1 Tax=Streptomyces sp. BH106 TaxID=3410409 RepID=UPI003CF1B1F1
MNRLDAFLARARTYVGEFLQRLDGLHPAVIVPVVVLLAVVIGATALAVVIIATAVASIATVAAVALLARRVIVAAVAYSNQRHAKIGVPA